MNRSPATLTMNPNLSEGQEVTADAAEYYALLRVLLERSLPHLHALSMVRNELLAEEETIQLFVGDTRQPFKGC